MKTETYPFDRALAREGRYDGKFLIGVMTTGIYCLPSCAARAPKPENIRILKTEAEAQGLGLRACKRCRPDLFYRGEDENIALFDGLAARVRATPEAFPDASSLARACGVSLTKLNDLFRDHAHLAPAAWLRRERVRAASALLLDSSERVVDIGFASGFESESVFHRQFVTINRMTPGAYRALSGASVFLLHLPKPFRAQEILLYHARDPESPCERVEGRRIFKALMTRDAPAVLEISLEEEGAWCRVHADGRLGPDSMAFLHRSGLRMLGLAGEVSGFEARMSRDAEAAPFFARRKGLRVPLIPTGMDALAWAIIGQQINVPFAASLRREIIHMAGEKVGKMRAHPPAARIANLDIAQLTSRRFSRSKGEYLIGAAQAVASGDFAVENLTELSAVAAEKKLTAIRGIGMWTARYAMLRSGFADAAPVGDSALAAALQRLHGLDERPDQSKVVEWMKPYAPHRSLATCHLWASLKDAA